MSTPEKFTMKPIEVVAMLNDPDNCPEDTVQWVLDNGGEADVSDNERDVLLLHHTARIELAVRVEPGDYVVWTVHGWRCWPAEKLAYWTNPSGDGPKCSSCGEWWDYEITDSGISPRCACDEK